jgi:hypothetical protein
VVQRQEERYYYTKETERKSGCILKFCGLHPIPLLRGGGKLENPEKNHRQHALNYQESHTTTRRKMCTGERNQTHNPQVPLTLVTDALPLRHVLMVVLTQFF